MRRLRATLRIVALLLASAASGVRAQSGPPELDFQGRRLVVLSDGDMHASAYAGAALGPPAADTLSVIQLGGDGGPSAAGSVEVANSVVGPPASLAVTPDGRYAVAIETRGPHPPERADARLTDLPPGRTISVIDLRDPAHPAVVQRLAGRDNPIAVSIAADGGMVAIAYDTSATKGAPLDLYRFTGGRLSDAASPAIPGFGGGDSLKNAAFAPNGALALVYSTRPRFSLLRVAANGRPTTLTRWGEDVPLGRTPFEVRFTPDGRFALVNDMTVPTEGTDVRGTVISIALDAGRAPDGAPVHRIVSQARTGVLPEGLTVSPDGRWVVTTNLERTSYAADDPRQGFFASLTLLRLDPQTGRLVRVGDFPFAGVIPEAAAFDGTGRFLAVASFDRWGIGAGQGSVDIWRIASDFQDPSRVELAPTGLAIPIARGAHSMEIVR